MKPGVEELLAEFIANRELPGAPSVEEFVARHAGEGPALQRALEQLEELEELFPDSCDGLEASPERIGDYSVVEDLGRGGMGRVLRVTHPSQPGSSFALKQLHPVVAANPRAVERFRREGQILARIEHPGVVRIHAVEADSTPPFLVMELVEGESMASLLSAARERHSRGHPIERALDLCGPGGDARGAARLVRDAARAVEAVHAQELLHRDIKPANLIVRPDGTPVLIDFGLAVHGESETITASGDLVGTPHYMAPEQAAGQKAEARTDVYGLGAVLYELLTLCTPHAGQDPLDVLQHIAHDPIPRVRARNPQAPAELVNIVQRATAWKASRRYASAAELADDLDRFLAGELPRARRRGLPEACENLARHHPQACALALGLFLILLCTGSVAWFMADEEARLEAPILKAAALAWIAEDDSALGRVANELAGDGPNGARAGLFRAHAEHRIPEPSGDAAVDAVATGLRWSAAGDHAAACEEYRKASKLAPGWALPVALVGRAALLSGADDLAERELTIASRWLPESAPLAAQLAELQMDRERYAEAKSELQRALRFHPDDWRLWYSLAKAHAKAREQEQALDAIFKAMELCPESDTALLNLYAATVDRLGDHEAARAILRDLIDKHPRNAALEFNLAYSLDLECKLPEATAAYRRTIELDPDNLKAIMALAHIHGGAMRATCERCQVGFRDNPELYDEDEAQRLVLEAIALDRCKTSWVPDLSVMIAKRIGREQQIGTALRAVIADSEVDERAVRVERALRRL